MGADMRGLSRRGMIGALLAAPALLLPGRSAAAGWDAHLSLLMEVPGAAGAGIYTQGGSLCAQRSLSLSGEDVAALGRAFAGQEQVSLLGRSFTRQRADGTSVLLSSGRGPLCAYRTRTLYLIVAGRADADGGAIRSAIGRDVYPALADR